ncbi:MAG TPA: flagellar basal body protein [Solirubrobacteraceae bacterium]|jgi:flagellar basal-body rod protein FlgB|nr:flagellar basal body protein [Solirubrobacteraceae bacterium]
MALVDPTQQLLETAMRGAWQRQTALTGNIANADTPGYQRKDVNFESTLDAAINSGEPLSQVQFQTESQPSTAGPNGENISIDQESAQLAEDGLDYQALTQVVSARNAIVRSAIGIV